MDNLEKSKLIASICHIGRFLKPEILIYNSEVLDKTGTNIRGKRRTQAIVRRFAFQGNAENVHKVIVFFSLISTV